MITDIHLTLGTARTQSFGIRAENDLQQPCSPATLMISDHKFESAPGSTNLQSRTAWPRCAH